jgi:hypothetical protein
MNYSTIPFRGLFRVTQREYGAFSHRLIPAMDLVGITGPQIYGTCEGTVTRAGWEDFTDKKAGFGYYVRVTDKNGNNYYFAHMSAIYVYVGQKVSYNTILGLMGTTGNSTGLHLHYEVRRPDKTRLSVAQLMGIPNAEGTYNSNNYLKTTIDSSASAVGFYKTLTNMRVRVDANSKARHKLKSELSADGQRNCIPGIYGTYKAGTVFSVQSFVVRGNEVWAKTPSGYICIRDKKNEYCKKI